MCETNENAGENNVGSGEAPCPTERREEMKKPFSLWKKTGGQSVETKEDKIGIFFFSLFRITSSLSWLWGTANFSSLFFFFPFEQVLPFWYISRVESDGGDSSYKPALRSQ